MVGVLGGRAMAAATNSPVGADGAAISPGHPPVQRRGPEAAPRRPTALDARRDLARDALATAQTRYFVAAGKAAAAASGSPCCATGGPRAAANG